MAESSNKLGLWGSCAYCMGGMIGSGIFLSSSSILKFCGSYGISLIVWALAGLITVMAALVYLEMGTSIPVNGGGYAYLTRAGWHPLASSFFWLGTFFTYPSTLAALSVGVAENVAKGLKILLEYDDFVENLLLFVSFLNLGKSIRFQASVTSAKIVVIVLIVIIGIVYLFQGHTQVFDDFMNGSANDPLDIVMAVYIGLFSYSGYEVLNVVMGEIRRRVLTTFIAGTGTVLVVMFIYLTVNVSYFTVLSKKEILGSSAVSVAFFDESLHFIGKYVPFIVSFLLLSNLNMVIFGAGRFMATGAKNKVMPAVIGYTHKASGSPRLAILIQMLISIGLSFVSELSTLISYMSFAEVLDRFIVLSAFLYMRYHQFKFAEDAFRNPILIIVIYLAICGGLICLPIYRVGHPLTKKTKLTLGTDSCVDRPFNCICGHRSVFYIILYPKQGITSADISKPHSTEDMFHIRYKRK
ncbi:unnamed protein product [Bursaphelenchus xylophilus]|uniref:(pine wood nematode) hypothetical protein n=1 Tax=Bursaphelenchus xylophilus TaxID=6326 RepID=A0A811KKT7_BURXY|nr:unnamed protein product [Bursaphelenchus xylophilus]CAG9099364.1 unnamed protein product [Bursaphelenchus xylophilus]